MATFLVEQQKASVLARDKEGKVRVCPMTKQKGKDASLQPRHGGKGFVCADRPAPPPLPTPCPPPKKVLSALPVLENVFLLARQRFSLPLPASPPPPPPPPLRGGGVLQSSLMWACEKRHLPMVTFLLDLGASVNAPDKDGRTPLMWAVGRLAAKPRPPPNARCHSLALPPQERVAEWEFLLLFCCLIDLWHPLCFPPCVWPLLLGGALQVIWGHADVVAHLLDICEGKAVAAAEAKFANREGLMPKVGKEKKVHERKRAKSEVAQCGQSCASVPRTKRLTVLTAYFILTNPLWPFSLVGARLVSAGGASGHELRRRPVTVGGQGQGRRQEGRRGERQEGRRRGGHRGQLRWRREG